MARVGRGTPFRERCRVPSAPKVRRSPLNSFLAHLRHALLLVAALAPALPAPPALAQEDVGILRLARAIAAQERLNADLRTSAPRLEAEAAAESERLARDEASLREADVSLAALRQARFEADTRRTRLAATASRIEFFAD